MPTLDQIQGCILGLVLADALGARFEGKTRERIHRDFSSPKLALDYAGNFLSFQYTDDGQMALALAEYLTTSSQIVPNELMGEFCRVYESWRGYGRGARTLIEAFRDDAEYEFMAEHLFPGGSHGNGGAMRSAPVGLRYSQDFDQLWQEARNSAWPTHRHVLGIEGAQLIALTTAIALRGEEVAPKSIADELLNRCETQVFKNRLETLAKLTSVDQVAEFGNGIEAHESAVTAIACFTLYPDSYSDAIAAAIWQGGDTDTIAAMTGALVGARKGAGCLPNEELGRLEDKDFLPKIYDLCARLASVC